MDTYQIEWKPSAARELRRLPRDVVVRVVQAVESRLLDPFPIGVKKLVGAEHTYRMRLGDYRVVYTIWEDVLIIYFPRRTPKRGLQEAIGMIGSRRLAAGLPGAPVVGGQGGYGASPPDETHLPLSLRPRGRAPDCGPAERSRARGLLALFFE